MNDVSVFLDVLRKVNNLVQDARAEFAEFEGDILLTVDETELTITIHVESKALPKGKKPTKE